MKGIYTIYKCDVNSGDIIKCNNDPGDIRDNTIRSKGDVNINEVEKSSNELEDLDKGWSWVVLCACFGTCCIVGANNYGAGIVHKILLERYNESVSLTAWSGALQLALMCLAAPLSSAVIDKYSCRVSVTISGILFVSGYWATAFAPSMHVAIFTCGVMAGTAAGFGYTASIVAIGFNFKRRKHMVLGVALSGMGAGIFAFAPLMDLAYDHYGSTGFFIMMATLSANILTFGALLFPSKLELLTHKRRNMDAESSHENKAFVGTFKMYYTAVLKKPIILLCIAMFTFCFGFDIIILHQPTFVVFKGFSSIQAAFLVSLNGILSVIGRFMTGLISSFKQINVIWLYSGCMGIVSIATVVYPFIANTFAGHISYVVILGLFFGSGYVLVSPMCSKFVDINFSSAAIGLVLFSAGVGSVAGPVTAGVLLDNGGTYDQCILGAGCFVLVAAIFGALTVCCQPVIDTKESGPVLVSYGVTDGHFTLPYEVATYRKSFMQVV